jgi:uncharacterized coiled-coil protein SlyX
MQVSSLQSQLLRLKQDIAEQKRFIHELGRAKRYHGIPKAQQRLMELQRKLKDIRSRTLSP